MEIREAIAIKIYHWLNPSDGWAFPPENIKEEYHKKADQILAIREEGKRLAIVKEKGELPVNPYILGEFETSILDCSMRQAAYNCAQNDMLKAHYVQEEVDD